MTAVGPIPALTAYLRGQLQNLQRAPQAAAGQRPAAGNTAAAGHTVAGRSDESASQAPRRVVQRPPEDLAGAIARRVAVIDRADPDRRRKALRVFLESLLLQEWGEQLLNDPGFHQLVDTVQAQMEASAELQPLMQEAADRLLGPAA